MAAPDRRAVAGTLSEPGCATLAPHQRRDRDVLVAELAARHVREPAATETTVGQRNREVARAGGRPDVGHRRRTGPDRDRGHQGPQHRFHRRRSGGGAASLPHRVHPKSSRFVRHPVTPAAGVRRIPRAGASRYAVSPLRCRAPRPGAARNVRAPSEQRATPAIEEGRHAGRVEWRLARRRHGAGARGCSGTGHGGRSGECDHPAQGRDHPWRRCEGRHRGRPGRRTAALVHVRHRIVRHVRGVQRRVVAGADAARGSDDPAVVRQRPAASSQPRVDPRHHSHRPGADQLHGRSRADHAGVGHLRRRAVARQRGRGQAAAVRDVLRRLRLRAHEADGGTVRGAAAIARQSVQRLLGPARLWRRRSGVQGRGRPHRSHPFARHVVGQDGKARGWAAIPQQQLSDLQAGGVQRPLLAGDPGNALRLRRARDPRHRRRDDQSPPAAAVRRSRSARPAAGRDEHPRRLRSAVPGDRAGHAGHQRLRHGIHHRQRVDHRRGQRVAAEERDDHCRSEPRPDSVFPLRRGLRRAERKRRFRAVHGGDLGGRTDSRALGVGDGTACRGPGAVRRARDAGAGARPSGYGRT